MKMLMIGATGMLGKPVAAQLIKEGVAVTLLARDVVKTQQLFPSAQVMRGDVFNKESLLQSFGGHDAVYLNLSVLQSSKQKDLQPEREGIDNIITAARQTGIKRLLYLSSLVHFYNGMNNFDWWAFRIKHSAIGKIKASGLSYTIFYPSTFMETFPYQMMQGKRVALLGDSIMPMWFIAAEDYAKQVARSLAMAVNDNKEYNVQGLEPLKADEAAKVFIKNYRKAKLKVLKAPGGLMKFLGNFNQKLNYGWHICEALNKYPEKFESESTWTELGKPSIRLADYAANL